MRAVDTNVPLRFVLRDDEPQFAAAAAFFSARTAEDPAFVSLIVLNELIWALRQRYGFDRAKTRNLIETLLETAELVFEDEASLSQIVARADRGDRPPHFLLGATSGLHIDCHIRSRRRKGCARHGTSGMNPVAQQPGAGWFPTFAEGVSS